MFQSQRFPSTVKSQSAPLTTRKVDSPERGTSVRFSWEHLRSEDEEMIKSKLQSSDEPLQPLQKQFQQATYRLPFFLKGCEGFK